QAQSQGGGGGGGGGGQQQIDALSEQERQIISATFNVQRDKRTVAADKFRQNSTVVGLSQQKLREQVEGLLTRMNSEDIQQAPKLKQTGDLLQLQILLDELAVHPRQAPVDLLAQLL